MGASRTDYLMWAANVGARLFDWDKHSAENEGRPDRRFDVIYDGMSGMYCMAGKIIAVSDEFEGFTLHKIDPNDIGVDREELAAKVAEAFGVHVSSDEFSLVLFSHYS